MDGADGAWCLTRSTLTSGTGLKTRHFGTIISELTSCINIHTTCGSRLGGVSLEFTGELNDEGFSVTECLGGSMELGEEELGLRYQVRRSFFCLCELLF
ncbi:class-II DAHP synthetase family-domain-containing protein [Butyriboletus roseoflavus]|nr:class-II DAHP synthetase family-domain-containing protein [Butyriboletus roseoflavus]KAG8215585.1 class-II DAHP synthetase family-domain-containing protein [Butyriboletus roseoflavus]